MLTRSLEYGTRLGSWMLRSGVLVLILFGCSLAMNVYFALGSRSGVTVVKENQLSSGMVMPVLTAQRVGGKTETVHWSGTQDRRGTVLYVFSPTCGWCSRNLNNIRYLSAAKSGEYRFIGLSLINEGVSEYVATNHIDFPVYLNAKDLKGDKPALSSTPYTLLISNSGTITNTWAGAYSGVSAMCIEQMFNAQLPGLSLASEFSGGSH